MANSVSEALRSNPSNISIWSKYLLTKHLTVRAVGAPCQKPFAGALPRTPRLPRDRREIARRAPSGLPLASSDGP